MKTMTEEIKKLIDTLSSNDVVVIRDLEWMNQGDNHGLNDYSHTTRYLLKKIRELEQRIYTLENNEITFGDKL